MFGMDVLTKPQIDLIVLDFPIFLALGNGGLKVSILDLQIDENCGFSPLEFVRGTYEHPYRR